MSDYEKIKKIAHNEVTRAISWYTSFFENYFPLRNIQIFTDITEKLIYSRICKHWYSENPSKGSGYRSIINDYHVDPILLSACKSADINPKFLPSQCVLIISPGIVRVRSMTNEREEKVLYEGFPYVL